MRDGSLRDCLIVLAAAMPIGAAFGALLGWSKNELGVSDNPGLVLMVVFVVLVGRFSSAWVGARARARQNAQGRA